MDNEKKEINKNDLNNKQNKNEPKKKSKHIVRKILIGILILILILIGYLAYKTYRNGGGIQGFLSTILGQNETTIENLEEIRVLVLGSSQNLTDTIMVASYNPKTQEASLLSIPRDSFIGDNKEKATSWDKLNSVYQGKYPEKVLKEVCELLRINIKYYVIIDTDALIELVDTIGGVKFDVPIDMDYDDPTQGLHIYLKKGEQLIDGVHAEQLLRFRHNNDGSSYSKEYGDNDYGRMRTQREFITAVINQTLKPQNILKIGDIIDISYKNLVTNLKISDIKDYVPFLVNFSSSDLKTATIAGYPDTYNKLSFIVHNNKEVNEVVNELFIHSIDDVNKSLINIELINASNNKENLTKVKELLEKAGYKVIKTSTNKSQVEKSEILNRTSESEIVIDDIKSIINIYNTKEGTVKSTIDFTIIIGNDINLLDDTQENNNY